MNYPNHLLALLSRETQPQKLDAIAKLMPGHMPRQSLTSLITKLCRKGELVRTGGPGDYAYAVATHVDPTQFGCQPAILPALNLMRYRHCWPVRPLRPPPRVVSCKRKPRTPRPEQEISHV